MGKIRLPAHLEDKIFEIKSDPVLKITSYFPFSESEKREICNILNVDVFDGFHSIFTDSVSNEEWNKTKDQIKKRFKDELFGID